jgi:aminoglycoside 3-N-acetyltransferase
LGIKKNDVVYISGNLTNFGKTDIKNLNNLPKIFFKTIKKKIGSKGTIVVPSHSFYLVKTKKTFDPKKTFSESGSFSNYIINLKNTVRQHHPYSSSSAIGKKAKFICSNNTFNAYGSHSPFERMIKLNTKFISLGMNINLNCSQVHQAEYDMHVPYRYSKEFSHRIKMNKKIVKKKFYLFVLYKEYTKLKRDNNKKIIKNFLKYEKVKKQK